jgi:hypothetical protein
MSRGAKSNDSAAWKIFGICQHNLFVTNLASCNLAVVKGSESGWRYDRHLGLYGLFIRLSAVFDFDPFLWLGCSVRKFYLGCYYRVYKDWFAFPTTSGNVSSIPTVIAVVVFSDTFHVTHRTSPVPSCKIFDINHFYSLLIFSIIFSCFVMFFKENSAVIYTSCMCESMVFC